MTDSAGGQRLGRDTRPFSGYHNRPTANDDSFITSVGPGTPGGEYLRRYWHPFLISSELKDLPVAVRLLGEDLVVFRDGSGRIGLLHRHCVHRGTSLEYGIIAERGIRCCYHGWHFDVDGTILDTPAEPPTSRIKSHFCQGAYKVHEWKGLLFAYMGPVDEMPAFPEYDCVDNPADNQPVPFRMNLPCNWVQIVENGCDPIHNAYLHAIVAGEQFSATFKILPQLDFPRTPLGFLSMATRKAGDHVFIRASDIVLPNFGQFPNGANMANRESLGLRPYLSRWAVAVDDHHSFYIGLAHLNSYNNPQGSMSPADFGVDQIPFIGQTGDRPHAERQREPGDYDAVVTQGRVANRKAEHLGTTDRGVVLFRRMLAQAIGEVQEGKKPEVPRLSPQGPVRTYASEIVVRAPEGVLDDPQALAAFGQRAALAFVQTDHLLGPEREAATADKVQALLRELSPAGAK
jgi:phenylpropionate dioxygenase-like ring-hydroxylating dioxygenase large terminal subunit